MGRTFAHSVSMKPAPRSSRFPLLLVAAVGVSCSHSPEDADLTESNFTRSPAARSWSVQGVRIPSTAAARAGQYDRDAQGLGGELMMGPDASLAGPGALEEALAIQPQEPLPDGAGLGQTSAPGHPDGLAAPGTGTGLDGIPLEPTAPVPRSPFDPALQNPPPGDKAETPAPAEPVAPPTNSGAAVPKVENP